MASKRSRQRIKNNKRRLVTMIALVFLLLMLSYFLAFSIHNLIVCRNIHSGNLKEYSGSFNITKVQRTRNTVYFFTLENGDVIRAIPELIEHGESITQFTNLRFTYATPKSGFPPAYTGVEITEQEGTAVFLTPENASEEAQKGAALGIIFFAIVLALIIPLAYAFVSDM